jgi:hypothetical protein
MNVTNCDRKDGFGAQYYNIIWAILYAELHGHKFYYTPFECMEHNYDNDPNYLNNKENLINIIGNFPLVSELDTDDLVMELCPCNVPFPNFSDLKPLMSMTSLDKIKNAFYQNKESIHDLNFLNIAVHVRRFNEHDTRKDSIQSDDYFLKVINHIRKEHPEPKIFHIYSQGKEEDFSNFKEEDMRLHLNESVESTFISMATAQILVMSKSALSYCAAILSDGIIYYLPYTLNPPPNWKILI